MLLFLLAELLRTAFAANYGNIPLHFEPNLGQTHSSVRFLGYAQGYTLELDGTQATVRTDSGEVRMRLNGARAPLQFEPMDKLPGATNYLNKPNEAEWVRNVPQYRRLKLPEVYPGIDLIYYGAQRHIEYDFIVAPHADPNRIRFHLDGATLNRNGDLNLPGGLRQHAPVAYQMVRGRRVPVKAAYRLKNNEITFAIGRYDRRQPLIIDPTITYATFAGTDFGWFYGIAVDGTGAAYAAGRFAKGANIGAFVAKLNPAGTAYTYFTFLGDATPSSIAINNAGAAYVTGVVSNGSYPVKNAYQSTLRQQDMFLTKVNPAGNDLEFSTFFGGTRDDAGTHVRVDAPTGAVYLLGSTNSNDVPLVSAAFTTGTTTLTKFTDNGSALIFSTYLPSSVPGGLALEPTGNAVVSSQSGNPNVPLVNPISNVTSSPYLARLSPLGVALQLSHVPSGGGPIAVDSSGNIFIAGTGADATISRLPAGTIDFRAIANLGTGITIKDLAVDPQGNVYATGIASSTATLPEFRSIQTHAGLNDIFLTKISRNGEFFYSTYYGGSDEDEAYALAVDSAGAAYIAGSSGSNNLPLVNPVFMKTVALRDGILAKFTEGADSRIITTTVNTSPPGLQVTVDGVPFTAPARFNWVVGSQHTISTEAIQNAGPLRYRFANWSSGSAITQQITTPGTVTTFTANFQTQVRPNVTIFPAASGSVTINPVSPDGYYDVGTQLTVTATPAAGYLFQGYTGGLAGTNPTQNLTVNPASTAIFASFLPSTESGGLGFIPVTPCRVIDTRPSFAPGGSTRDVNLPASTCGVPSTARAYSLIITVVPRRPLSFLTVYPTGQQRPLVSTLNAFEGQIIANSAIVPAGSNGSISVFVTDDTDFIIDVYGYFTDFTAPGALLFYPTTPCRVIDTRPESGGTGSAFGPPAITGAARSFPISQSSCGIPSSARAYAFNITVVPNGFFQYITAWPTGEPQPPVSVQNSPQGRVIATTAIIPAGTNGAVSLSASGTTHAVVDITGYFAPAGQPGGLRFFTVNPCRAADTRPSEGFASPNGPPIIDERNPRDFFIGGRCNVPTNAVAYSLNATVVPPAYLGYITLYPAYAARPLASNLNAWEGQVAANAAIVPGTGGVITAYVSNPTHLILDVNGYFAAVSP